MGESGQDGEMGRWGCTDKARGAKGKETEANLLLQKKRGDWELIFIPRCSLCGTRFFTSSLRQLKARRGRKLKLRDLETTNGPSSSQVWHVGGPLPGPPPSAYWTDWRTEAAHGQLWGQG